MSMHCKIWKSLDFKIRACFQFFFKYILGLFFFKEEIQTKQYPISTECKAFHGAKKGSWRGWGEDGVRGGGVLPTAEYSSLPMKPINTCD